MRKGSLVAGLISRDRAIIAGCVLLVTVLAWAYLFRLDHQMTAAMASDSMVARMGMTMIAPWSAREFVFTFAMWAVMMVGMMAPAVAPVTLLYGQMRTSRDSRSGAARGLLFGAAQISVWIAFSAVAAMLQWTLHQAAVLSPGMAVTSSRIAGAILIAAGAYQLSPVKGECLSKCQSPLGFLLANWREGNKGAFQLGLRHGAYCLGCCWALMLVLFVVGVMNLAAVVVLTAFILLEKLGPSGVRIARAGGVVMIAFGALTLFKSAT